MQTYGKKFFTPILAFGLVFLAGCTENEENASEGNNDTEEQQTENGASVSLGEQEAMAEIKDVNGEELGEIQFSDKDGKTMIEADLENVDPGHHGFHVHENGECDPEAADGPFTSAGGHYSPGDTEHGTHTGDMPSLFVNDDGSAYLVAATGSFTTEQLVEDATAVVIHEKPDNFGNIPDRYQSSDAEETGPDEETLGAGDAGSRQACGVIKEVD